jgi:TolB-like protein
MERVERRLAAVLAADVAGYSRLMGTDEEGTLARLKAVRKAIVDPNIAAHRGRIVKTTGDGMLVEFASAVDAVRSALEVQRAMAEQNVSVPKVERIEFRIGIHVGDIIIDDSDIFGDGVNIAARLEAVAEPGGVCISDDAHRQVRGKVSVDFYDLGEQTLKNIDRPIRAYAVSLNANPDPALPPLSSAPRLSIVVLPLANIGGDPEQEYFVDGVTESLTTDLSRIAGALVIARNTAFTFKGKAVDVKKIGRDLDVRYVLEGSVQRSGNRMRVNVQLIDAQSGHHLWADRFDKPVADIFDMQDEIVTRLASTLDAQFVVAEARRAERTAHPDATDMYFQGLAWLYRGLTLECFTRAQHFFERGLALDPGNVDLLVCTAVVDAGKAANFLTDDRQARFAAAEAALTKALSKAPDHAHARMFLGFVFNSTNRPSQGMAECERALSLNPNLALAHAYVGHAKYLLGRGSETEAHVNAALRLSPRDTFAYIWFIFVGVAKSQTEAYADAVEWLRRSTEANRSYSIAYFQLAAALAQCDKLGEASAAMKEGLALNPGFTIHRFRSYLSTIIRFF